MTRNVIQPALIPKTSLLVISILFSAITSSLAADLRIVEEWLRTNTGTDSLRVDFVQSRSLKSIKNPISQPGTLWLDYRANQFRWQLGDPAKTIVVSQGDKVAVMRTPLKRVEFRDSSSEGATASGSPGLSSLTGGFPRTLPEFQQKYRIVEIRSRDNSHEIVTQPLGPEGKGVDRFRFVIDKERFLLKGLVIDLDDGSTVTTTFKRVIRNPEIQAGVFKPDLTGYRETKFRQG